MNPHIYDHPMIPITQVTLHREDGISTISPLALGKQFHFLVVLACSMRGQLLVHERLY